MEGSEADAKWAKEGAYYNNGCCTVGMLGAATCGTNNCGRQRRCKSATQQSPDTTIVTEVGLPDSLLPEGVLSA